MVLESGQVKFYSSLSIQKHVVKKYSKNLRPTTYCKSEVLDQ